MRPLDPRHLLARSLLPRYAAGNLPSPLRNWVGRRLQHDAELAARYDALRRAERVAAKGAPLSAGQVDLLESAILDAVAGAGAPQRSRVRGSLVPGLLAAAAVSLFVVVARPPAGDDARFGVGDLAARGAALQQHPLGIKVACVMNEAVIDSASAGARDSGDVLRCGKGGLLAFSTTNLAGETRHVFVVGIAKDGSRRWYAPFDKDGGSVIMPAGQVDALLPTLADTSTMPGDDVALFVLLSDEAFSGRDVERQLASSERGGTPLGRLERLPVSVPLQGRIELVQPPR